MLYGAFVLTQTVRHRDFFLPVDARDYVPLTRPPGDQAAETRGRATDSATHGDGDDEPHAEPPSNRETMLSLGLLLTSLVAVVGLAKVESPAIESLVADAGLPHTFVGVVIALLVLLPESIAACRAALLDRMQTSLNLAFGSAMASIGLTIPAIAVATIWLDQDLVLGLGGTQTVLTVVPGRATRLQGSVHLAILAAFVFLAMQP